MAKKDNENFDFDTESDGKVKFDLAEFLKNLTKQQKGIILIAAVAIVLVVVIVVVCIIVGANNGNGTGNGNNNGNQVQQVPDEELAELSISSTPTKISYFVGDMPNYEGLSVYVVTADGNRVTVRYLDDPDAFTITGFDSSAPATKQIVTVECKGLSDTFTVDINAIPQAEPELVSIHLSTYPKQIYNVDDKFSYSTGVLTCTYSDGSTIDIPLELKYMYGVGDIFDPTGEHILLPGEHLIQIEYGENGVFVQTEYVITVN